MGGRVDEEFLGLTNRGTMHQFFPSTPSFDYRHMPSRYHIKPKSSNFLHLNSFAVRFWLEKSSKAAFPVSGQFSPKVLYSLSILLVNTLFNPLRLVGCVGPNPIPKLTNGGLPTNFGYQNDHVDLTQLVMESGESLHLFHCLCFASRYCYSTICF